MYRLRNIGGIRIKGLPRAGGILMPGEECRVERLPDAATMRYLEEVPSDEVQAINAENLRTVLDDERARRQSANERARKMQAALDAANAEREQMITHLRDAGARIEQLEAQVESQRDELEGLRARLGDLAGQRPWADASPKAVLAFANRQRAALGEEPFSGRGSTERAAQWLDINPDAYAGAWREEQGTE